MEHARSKVINVGCQASRRGVGRACVVVSLLAAVSVAGFPRIAPTFAAASEDACSEIPGHVAFHGLEVLPEAPQIGEDVELRFDTEIAVYYVSEIKLVGADLLAGATSASGTGDTSFQLTAVKAGRMIVELAVTYATEVQCIDANGVPYIDGYGDYHTVTSPGYVVDIAQPPCVGDCDRDGEVTIDELLTMVNIALGGHTITVSSCPASDPDGDRAVQITDIITAVTRALEGCGGPEGGYCYESSDCFASYDYPFAPFSTNRGRCCQLQRTEGGVPFSWCPAAAFDAGSAACARCMGPC